MRFDDVLVPASFVHRDNRFRVTVELDGQLRAAHLPNSGRLGELLTFERRVWLRLASGPARRKRYDLLLIEHAGTRVSVDARLPNLLLHGALLAGRLPPFAGYRTIRREVCLGKSRLDFLLEDQERRRWIETKSVTLVENGMALFPDALTVRGRRHLAALRAAAAGGPIAKAPGVAHDTIVVGGTSPTEARRLPYQPVCGAADNRCRRQIGFVDSYPLSQSSQW